MSQKPIISLGLIMKRFFWIIIFLSACSQNSKFEDRVDFDPSLKNTDSYKRVFAPGHGIEYYQLKYFDNIPSSPIKREKSPILDKVIWQHIQQAASKEPPEHIEFFSLYHNNISKHQKLRLRALLQSAQLKNKDVIIYGHSREDVALIYNFLQQKPYRHIDITFVPYQKDMLYFSQKSAIVRLKSIADI